MEPANKHAPCTFFFPPLRIHFIYFFDGFLPQCTVRVCMCSHTPTACEIYYTIYETQWVFYEAQALRRLPSLICSTSVWGSFLQQQVDLWLRLDVPERPCVLVPRRLILFIYCWTWYPLVKLPFQLNYPTHTGGSVGNNTV